MAKAADLRAIEDDCPWLREDFQAGLASLTESTAEQARRFARDMVVLAELTAQVPRCPFDERGASPWTSFRREVAVARKMSDRGAAAEIRASVALTTYLPRTLGQLAAGLVTVQRARALITELEGVDPTVAYLVDAQLADRIGKLSVARIQQEARRVVLTADPDAAARRTADNNDSREVIFMPDNDDQVSVVLCGPAVPLTRWHQTLVRRARALKAAGDPRTLAQLKFDLAVAGYPCAEHTPADPTASPTADPRDDAEQVAAAAAVVAGGQEDASAMDSAEQAAAEQVRADQLASDQLAADQAATAPGLRPSFVEPASTDCRMSRPVQANIGVPVETSLGLSNEPGWLEGYGWLSAPTCRLLLVDAELRRICLRSGTGEVIDRDTRDVRPPPTFIGLRHALVDLVVEDITLTGAADRVEDRHDPSGALRELVELRDRYDDGPTGNLRPAGSTELDHDTPWPTGPTAAWNLVARSTRTHQLKHHGWTPLRTPTSTFWFSPAGQCVEVPRHQQAPPGIDQDYDTDTDLDLDLDAHKPATLPDPDQLATTDLAQLQPQTTDDLRPWTTGLPKDDTRWTWLDDSAEPPF